MSTAGAARALSAVLALLLSGCTGTAPERAGKAELAPCTVAGELAARCGTVRVPENPAEPRGRTISLRVVVVPADSAEHAPDPLFYLAGFGGAATDSIAFAVGTLYRVHLTRDLVFVDQRGTGASRRLTCEGLAPGGPTATPTGAALRSAVDACLASVRDRGDPRFDTTTNAVDDLDVVRAALGYDRINLYGGSYGVTSGLAYLQRHGEHVRTAVLDSGSLLDVRLWELTPRHAQQSFDRLAARCAADPRCGPRYQPAADLAVLVARLRARPVQVPVPGLPAPVALDAAGLVSALVDDYLAAPEEAVLLPAHLHAAVGGDWAPMVQHHLKVSPEAGAEVQLQMLTLRCSDAWAAIDPDRVRAARPTTPFAEAMLRTGTWQQELCALWPHEAGASGQVRTAASVVFLNGTVDPADPPANVAAAQATMPNSLAVAAPDVGHGVVQQGCVTSEAVSFLQLGEPPDPQRWAACIATLEPPAFP